MFEVEADVAFAVVVVDWGDRIPWGEGVGQFLESLGRRR